MNAVSGVLFNKDMLNSKQWIYLSTAVIVIISIRILTHRRHFKGEERKLNMHGLNNVNAFKEVFLAYLSAAILEPILSMSSLNSSFDNSNYRDDEVIINLLSLISICWWIYLITDAFSYEDVTQYFKYHVDLREEYELDPSRYPWFQLRDRTIEAVKERQMLSLGSIYKDVALWFLLLCIMLAWFPNSVVTHVDVIHAYVILFLWVILHHFCRGATAWTSNYFVTLLFPSTALMPMEYCLPLMDVADTVEDLHFIEKYRLFLIKRTGVHLIIET